MDFLTNFKKNIRIYFTLLFVVLISTLLLWTPFIFKQAYWFGLNIKDSSFQYIFRHFDGPLYIIAAKTLYLPKAITELRVETTLAPSYFAAHLPLYPLFIRLFSTLFGYLKSMIFVNLVFTSLLILFFYYFLTRLKISDKPVLLLLVFLFLPRFLVLRSIGAPEPLFILLIISSLFFFEKEKYLISGLLGAFATMTKTPGILLFFAYFLVFFEKYLSTRKIQLSWLYIFLVPLGLFSVFLIYWKQYGDFLAYFHSGDNIHLIAPYAVFNFQKIWVGTAWLEDVVFYFFLYLLTIVHLWQSKHRSFFYFSLVFFTATVFIQHRDISRYSLPLWPMAIIAFEKFFTSKKFLLAAIILLPAIYLFAWDFMVANVMPISDWRPFL